MKPLKILWVVECEADLGVWIFHDDFFTRQEARNAAANCRVMYGDKTRIVRFIREAA